MIKLFGILDFMAWISLVFFQFGIFKNLFLFFAIYLVVKGFLFFGDLISLLDGITGVLFLLAFIGISSVFTWITFLFLMQKSFLSLFL